MNNVGCVGQVLISGFGWVDGEIVRKSEQLARDFIKYSVAVQEENKPKT